MATAQDRKEKLDISPAEFEKIQESLKNKEFRDLFMDYVNEISDPANRELYEAELTQLESERGNNVRFITPTPGHVLKTRFLTGAPAPPAGSTSTVERTDKVFINMCTSKEIQQAFAERKAKGGVKGGNGNGNGNGSGGKKGQHWKIPHSINKGREDFDHAGKVCTVYDCIFHPVTYAQGVKSSAFQAMLAATAIEGVEREFGVKLDRRYKTPRMSFKGRPISTVIRTAADGGAAASTPTDQKTSLPSLAALTNIAGQTLAPPPAPGTVQAPAAEAASEPYGGLRETGSTTRAGVEALTTATAEVDQPKGSDAHDTEKGQPSAITPSYTITHRATRNDYQTYTTERVVRRHTGRPDALIVRVGLPGVTSSTQIHLSPTPTTFTLQATASGRPAKQYTLSVPLPFPINPDSGTAVLDRGREELVVTLGVQEKDVVVPEEVEGFGGAVEEVGDGEENDDIHGEEVGDAGQDAKTAEGLGEPSDETHTSGPTSRIEALPSPSPLESEAVPDVAPSDLPPAIDPIPIPALLTTPADPHPDPRPQPAPTDLLPSESEDESEPDGWVRVQPSTDTNTDTSVESGDAGTEGGGDATSKVEVAVDDDAVLVTLTNRLMFELDE
ncbi:pre-RNA processing PIH1/Nop17-domain-containing protein [Fimicolochytrium jonesii]|uniref:pre-RNA processing PIH1/Nop17-domain-containing protein n=1 Tax=Fimicolochytrium jonesii TaxID=1396493 RepID=UPI0022FE3B54|nr:pre-RNA processing PIH1/Nop17-domain-containing protein [Fimicolochytrium jonesii]KAI8826164.1 pre-RNA processing PIH1/Nop17-domain-containing protein [Fimicolochytrium jonesii]